MYRTSSQRVPPQGRNDDGPVPCLAENGGAGRAYAPVDPFKASLALGIRNVFWRTKDRTIDEVPVQRPARTLPQSYSLPVRHVQYDDPIHDQYHETDAPPRHHELIGDPPDSHPTVVQQPASFGLPWQNGDEDENLIKAFVPQGLIAAGIRDGEERRARDRKALARISRTLSYSTPSHKPPSPQTGLVGAITAHDRESVGIGASLTEREREREVVGETQRIGPTNGPASHQRGLLGTVTAHEREGAGLGLPLTERERVQERCDLGERQQLQQASSRNGPLQQTGLLRAILPHEEDREYARNPLIERERERRMAEARQRRFEELQTEAYDDRAPAYLRACALDGLVEVTPMEQRPSSKIRHTESAMPPSPDGDDSEPTEEGLLGKNPVRPKRNWKELEDRFEGSEAVLMEMPPPSLAPVDEASKNEAAMEEVKGTDKPTGRVTKTSRRLAARVGDSFHPKPTGKPDPGSPSAAEYLPMPESMEGLIRHPDVELTWFTITSSLVLDVVPRQMYLHLLLRFPALYFSRVTRIFQDANLGMGEIKRMALEAVDLDKGEGLHRMLVYQGVFPQEWHGGDGNFKASASYMNLRNSWQGFIDSLMREWKTLNIVSVLLLSAILTILQVDSAASNPLTRFSALLSLVCAFMSLIYGCLYIIRFGTMRKTHKAAEWANESERTSTSIFWNVWVMLAMPAVWLGWSMIFYIVCIMSFVWQTGTITHPHDYLPTDLEILIPRTLISCILALGMVYLVLIGATFRRYSDPMEQAWQERIQGWLAEKTQAPTGHEGYYQEKSGHEQQTRAPNQEAKVATKERSAPGIYYPPQKEVGSPPRASARANPRSARDFSPPASHAERPQSMTKTRRPLATPMGPRRSQKASHASVGTRSLAKLEGEETRESLSRAATPSFNPFVSFSQTAPSIEEAPTATLSSSTKRLEVEGDVYRELSQPALCGGPRPLTQLHEIETAYSETTGMREEVLPPRKAMAEGPQKDARAVPANASELEGMEEILVFDWGTRSIHAPLEARVASTSSITTCSLPPATNCVPKGWLEAGLTADAWEGFCTEIACSWVNVVNGRPGALADMLAFIYRRNGSLQTFGLAMVFVQSKAGPEPWPDRSDARNYTLYWGTRKGAHE